MKRHNVLFADLPLFSQHAQQAHANDDFLLENDTILPELPTVLVSAVNALHQRHNEAHQNPVDLFWSILAYPTLGSESNDVYYMPWSENPHSGPTAETRSEIKSTDPYNNLLHLFNEIGASDLIWVLNSSRISSAKALSHRLSSTLRYLIDVKGVKCQILLEEGTVLPSAFVPVLASLSIPVRESIADLTVTLESSYPVYPQLASFLTSKARIPHRKSKFELSINTPFPQPIMAFHSITHIGLDRVPLSMFEGEVRTIDLRCPEDESTPFSSESGLVITSLLRPGTSSTSHLPSWNALNSSWEYPDDVSLPTGPSFLLYSKDSTIFLRQLNLGDSANAGTFPSLEHFTLGSHSNDETSAMVIDYLPQKESFSDILTWLASHVLPPLATSTQDSKLHATSDHDTSSSADAIKSRFNALNESNQTILLDSLLSLNDSFYNYLLPSSASATISSQIPALDAQVRGASDFMDEDIPIDTGFATQPLDSPRSSAPIKTHDSIMQALEYLWERETSAFSRLEARPQGMKQNRRRSLLSSPNGTRDDVSTVGSESTASEPGQALLDAIRPAARNAATSPEGAPLRKVHTSQQLRHMLNRSRGASVTTSPNRSLSSSIETTRSASSATSTLLALSSPLAAPSAMDSPRALPPLSTSTSITHRRTSLTPLGSAQLAQRPHELAAAKPSASKSLTTLSRGSSKLPPLSAPSSSRSSHASSASSSKAQLPKLQSASMYAKQTTSSLASVSASPSAAPPSHAHDVSNEEDNRTRLTACCKAELGRMMPPTDKKFQDLVDRLSSICQIMLATRYPWDSVIPNTEFLKMASSQAKLLVQASQPKR